MQSGWKGKLGMWESFHSWAEMEGVPRSYITPLSAESEERLWASNLFFPYLLHTKYFMIMSLQVLQDVELNINLPSSLQPTSSNSTNLHGNFTVSISFLLTGLFLG
jgi:hypothetical protein